MKLAVASMKWGKQNLISLGMIMLLILNRECTRSGFCNFMHLKPISRDLRRELYGRRRAAALEHRIARFIFVFQVFLD